MFRVELLEGSGAAPTPGYTYVADRGINHPQAHAPTLSRKRGIRDAGKGGDISSRRANAIARHIAELDRENQRDVAIPVPVKQAREAGARGNRAKTTSNVRRILQSQKTFRNHLDDEEAAISNSGGGTGAVQAGAAVKNNKVTAAAAAVARRSSTPATTPVAVSGKSKKRVSEKAAGAGEAELMDVDGEERGEEEPVPKLLKTEYDNDPLLKSYTPSMPSERLLQMLLAEPPLTYNGSRAGPPVSAKAPRHFCCMCGYWGKIRCKNCHLRTCGLDCYRVHEDSRCGAFF